MPIDMLLGGVGARRSGPREPAAEGARGAVVVREDEAQGAGLMDLKWMWVRVWG